MQATEINGELAMKAIKRWKVDSEIKKDYAQPTDYYNFLVWSERVGYRELAGKALLEWKANPAIRQKYPCASDYHRELFINAIAAQAKADFEGLDTASKKRFQNSRTNYISEVLGDLKLIKSSKMGR